MRLHKNIYKTFLAFLSTLVILLFSYTAQADQIPLKVGVSIGEPFALVNHNEYYGIAIDLWKELADDLNYDYQFVPMGQHIDDAVAKLATGEIDILIGPIVPTDARIKKVDFMLPYYLNQIGLVVPIKHIIFFDVLNSIFDTTIITGLLILLLFFLLYLHVFWYYELRPNNKTHEHYWNGILEAFWLHTLDIDLGKIPTHIRTRLIRFLWLILVTIFFSSVTAAITSALTIALSHRYTSYSSINELKSKEIAAVINAAPYDIAKKMGFTNLVTVNTREEAIELLLKGKVAAYVDYYPIADYYLIQHELTHKLVTADNLVIQRNTFAFALPINSPLRHPLDLKLRTYQENGTVQVICDKYFPDDEKAAIRCEI